MLPNIVSAATPPTLTNLTIWSHDVIGGGFTGKVWNTQAGDGLFQAGVMSGGVFLDQGGLGEISIPLQSGLNTFSIVGTGLFQNHPYYGLVLFFKGETTSPLTAVYNENGGLASFSVQPAGTILGAATGGLFFVPSPVSSMFVVNGFVVEVVRFTINSMSSTTDLVSFETVGQDYMLDTTAQLVLRVTGLPGNVIPEVPLGTAIAGAAMIVGAAGYLTIPKLRKKQ